MHTIGGERFIFCTVYSVDTRFSVLCPGHVTRAHMLNWWFVLCMQDQKNVNMQLFRNRPQEPEARLCVHSSLEPLPNFPPHERHKTRGGTCIRGVGVPRLRNTTRHTGHGLCWRQLLRHKTYRTKHKNNYTVPIRLLPKYILKTLIFLWFRIVKPMSLHLCRLVGE